MDRNKPRPVFFNVFQIHLPVSGFVSIIHRITGILLVIALPFFLYLLELSLKSSESYILVTDFFSHITGKCLLLLWTAFLVQHFFSGLRHLLMDFDVGIEKITARKSALMTILLTLVVLIFWGAFIW